MVLAVGRDEPVYIVGEDSNKVLMDCRFANSSFDCKGQLPHINGRIHIENFTQTGS